METDLFAVTAATWPPCATIDLEGWRLRDGGGGGKRVSAATWTRGDDGFDIECAERRMPGPLMFQLLPGQSALDAALHARGYERVDPSVLLSAPVTHLSRRDVPSVTAFEIWPPLQIMKDLWDEGGIGAERRAVMVRVEGRKTAMLGRVGGRAAGTCFVAIHNDTAMVHALQIAAEHRRKGLARNMMVAAAQWAERQGASVFSLIVTEANQAARALYGAFGMEIAARYHYRVKRCHNPKAPS